MMVLMSEQEREEIRQDAQTGSLDGFADQSDAADTLGGRTYEDMLDQGFTVPERNRDIDRFENEHETLDDRLAEEEPDDVPGSGYGPPDEEEAPGQRFDESRAGRLVAPDEGAGPDTEKDLVAADDGFAGGGGSAEEAAVHYAAEDGAETEPDQDISDVEVPVDSDDSPARRSAAERQFEADLAEDPDID